MTERPEQPEDGSQPVEQPAEQENWKPANADESDPRAEAPEWWQHDSQPAPQGEPVEAHEPVEVTQPVEADSQPLVEHPQAPAESGEATIVVNDEPTTPLVAPTESIFRPASPEQPVSPAAEPTTVERLSEEEARLAAERAARRDARVAALAATAPAAVAAPAPVIVHKRTNDKFWGSLGLFLLRLVVAAIMAVRGVNLLTDLNAATDKFATTIIPEPQLMALITGVAAVLISFALVLGLLTRLAGLGVLLIAGGALAFVQWGPWSPLIPGQPGFLGEFELLLAAVGLLFLLIGAGGWSLDRSFRAGRERDKAERAALAG